MNNQNKEDISKNLLAMLPLFKNVFGPPNNLTSYKNISPSHVYTLITLRELGTLSVSEIGRILCVSKPNMTPLINKLIKENLIERTPSISDRRIINISLTSDGRIFLDGITKNMLHNIQSKLSLLSNEDLQLLNESLNDVHCVLAKLISSKSDK
ncbi:MAG TPA: MarR family transcriptional regulator [Clostridiales bacterium]|nr:MAG: hypothetical protein A2Y22_02055 [Clostridiales bacterium GWD2_32_59]HAN09079.1 MarR family transcriptional regulator [Clostridiales bacterium]